MMSTYPRSLLPIVLAADNFPSSPSSDPYPSSHPHTHEVYVPFHLTFEDYQHGLLPLGLLRPAVVQEMRGLEDGPWNFQYSGVDIGGEQDGFQIQSEGEEIREDLIGDEDGMEVRVECVFFKREVVDLGFQGVAEGMKRVVERWTDEGKFEEALGGEQDILCWVRPPFPSNNADHLHALLNPTFPYLSIGRSPVSLLQALPSRNAR